ncbi:MAG: hypothetical protein AB7F59_11740 [Bdellovibrionales bacterium]
MSECQNDFDFQPSVTWPEALPCFAFEGQLLCGFPRKNIDNTSEVVIELQGERDAILKALYPRLSLPELVRLIQKMTLSSEQKSKLLFLYNYKFSNDLEEHFDFLLSLPLAVQNWLSEKDIAPRDLEKLAPLGKQKMEHAQRALQFCIEKRLNKNQTLQACEWIQELLEMGHGEEILFTVRSTPDLYLQHLKTLRFPMTLTEDQKVQSQLQSFSWPNKTEARWVRQGDLAAVEIQLKAHTEWDLEKQISSLTNLKDQIKTIWRSGRHAD